MKLKFIFIGLGLLPLMQYAATTTTQFTAGVGIAAPDPFDVTVTSAVNFGSIVPSVGDCTVSIGFNGSDAGQAGGTCDGYSGTTTLGKLTLSYIATNVTISTVDVSGFTLSDGVGTTINSSYSSTTGYGTNTGLPYTGNPGGTCTISSGSPCYIYIGNVGFTIPGGAAAGDYSTDFSDGSAIQVTINYT